MDLRGVKQRHAGIVCCDQHGYFCAAKDDTFSALRSEASHYFAKTRPGVRIDDTQAELLINHLMDKGAIVAVGRYDLQTVFICQAAMIKRLLHGKASSNQTDLL